MFLYNDLMLAIIRGRNQLQNNQLSPKIVFVFDVNTDRYFDRCTDGYASYKYSNAVLAHRLTLQRGDI